MATLARQIRNALVSTRFVFQFSFPTRNYYFGAILIGSIVVFHQFSNSYSYPVHAEHINSTLTEQIHSFYLSLPESDAANKYKDESEAILNQIRQIDKFETNINELAWCISFMSSYYRYRNMDKTIKEPNISLKNDTEILYKSLNHIIETDSNKETKVLGIVCKIPFAKLLEDMNLLKDIFDELMKYESYIIDDKANDNINYNTIIHLIDISAWLGYWDKMIKYVDLIKSKLNDDEFMDFTREYSQKIHTVDFGLIYQICKKYGLDKIKASSIESVTPYFVEYDGVKTPEYNINDGNYCKIHKIGAICTYSVFEKGQVVDILYGPWCDNEIHVMGRDKLLENEKITVIEQILDLKKEDQSFIGTYQRTETIDAEQDIFGYFWGNGNTAKSQIDDYELFIGDI